MYTSTQQQKPEAFEAASGVSIPAGKCPCSRPLEGVWTTLQNPQPFWDVPQGQPSWALGLAGRKFSIAALAPKNVPMGSVSDTYRPMPAPKLAKETPQKCRPDAKSSALLEKRPCSSPSEGVWTASQNPQSFLGRVPGLPSPAAPWGWPGRNVRLGV